MIHQYIRDGTDAALLKPLFDLQAYYDEQHKAHPDEQWDREETAAETFVTSHEHEKIVDFFAMSAKDGSYGDAGDDEDKTYDGYLKSHPEALRREEIRGQPKVTDKVPSMLRMEIREKAAKK